MKTSWFTETPTEEGFYWFRESTKDRAVIVKLAYRQNILCAFSIGCVYRSLVKRMKGQWLGPITPENRTESPIL